MNSTKKGGAGAPKPEAPIVFQFTDEEAENRLSEYFTEEEFRQLDDPAWKARLEMMDKLFDSMSGRPEPDPTLDPELVLRLLRKRTVWKDNNFQVAARLFQLVPVFAKKNGISRAASSMVIPLLCDKIGDVKLKQPATEAMIAISEKCSLNFTFARGTSFLLSSFNVVSL